MFKWEVPIAVVFFSPSDPPPHTSVLLTLEDAIRIFVYVCMGGHFGDCCERGSHQKDSLCSCMCLSRPLDSSVFTVWIDKTGYCVYYFFCASCFVPLCQLVQQDVFLGPGHSLFPNSGPGMLGKWVGAVPRYVAAKADAFFSPLDSWKLIAFSNWLWNILVCTSIPRFWECKMPSVALLPWSGFLLINRWWKQDVLQQVW